jgi:hypothetical protein
VGQTHGQHRRRRNDIGVEATGNAGEGGVGEYNTVRSTTPGGSVRERSRVRR